MTADTRRAMTSAHCPSRDRGTGRWPLHASSSPHVTDVPSHVTGTSPGTCATPWEPRHRANAWGTAPRARGASGRDLCAPRLGHGHDFQQVAVGVLKVETPAAPAGVELTVGVVEGPAAVGEPLGLHPAEDGLELRLTDMEGVVMALARPGVEARPAPGFWRVGEVQRQACIDLHLREVAWLRLDRQAEDVSEERGRGDLVGRRHDGVV